MESKDFFNFYNDLIITKIYTNNMYKCICGARYHSPFDFTQHYNDNLHKDWFNLSLQYRKCDICCNHHKQNKFISCRQCRNFVCMYCCNRIYSRLSCFKCPYCRYVQ